MNEIYFAQIREDSRIERDLCDKFAPKRIVTIGSGGCTAFSLLNDDVEQVVIMDYNPAQMALIELKKAAILCLNHTRFLQFIGEKDMEQRERVQVYEQQLKTILSQTAIDFWDQHLVLIKQGINYSGATEKFYQFVGNHLRKNVYSDEVWSELFQCSTIDEQKKFYKTYCTSESWQTAIRILLSKTTHLQFYPAQMFSQSGETDFSDFFAGRFKAEISQRKIRDNYFLSQLLWRSYRWEEDEGMPYYLSEQGFLQAKRNLHKCTLETGDITLLLDKQAAKVDAFFLSNVMDWASKTDRSRICQAITKSKAPEAIFLLRSMWGIDLPIEFLASMKIDLEECQNYLNLERAMMYQKLIIGVWGDE